MNLIDTLRRMAADAETGRWASRAPNKDAEDREAIETVRAMQEALRKIAAIENKEYGSDWEEIDEARDIANEALRRAEGNAG